MAHFRPHAPTHLGPTPCACHTPRQCYDKKSPAPPRPSTLWLPPAPLFCWATVLLSDTLVFRKSGSAPYPKICFTCGPAAERRQNCLPKFSKPRAPNRAHQTQWLSFCCWTDKRQKYTLLVSTFPVGPGKNNFLAAPENASHRNAAICCAAVARNREQRILRNVHCQGKDYDPPHRTGRLEKEAQQANQQAALHNPGPPNLPA